MATFALLARVSHWVTTAAADPGMSTALRSVGLFDMMSSTPPEPDGRALCSYARLRQILASDAALPDHRIS